MEKMIALAHSGVGAIVLKSLFEEQNLPPTESIQPENLFPFHVCTMDAFGNGNKRLTEK